jgi:hypothetical protein
LKQEKVTLKELVLKEYKEIYDSDLNVNLKMPVDKKEIGAVGFEGHMYLAWFEELVTNIMSY